MESRSLTSQELEAQVLKLPIKERWQLVQTVLTSLQYETSNAVSAVDDEEPTFPCVYYRMGSSGQQSAVVKGTSIRVQTLAIAANQWNWTPTQIAEEYDLSTAQVSEALSFYQVHKAEIDNAISAEVVLEAAHG